MLPDFAKQINELLKLTMLYPGSTHTIQFLIKIRFIVIAINLPLLAAVCYRWDWIRDSYGADITILFISSLLVTLVLYLFVQSKYIYPLTLLTFFVDLTVETYGIIQTGSFMSAIIMVPLLTVMITALVLGNRSAFICLGYFFFVYIGSVYLLRSNSLPIAQGPIWETVKPIVVTSDPLHWISLQIIYYILILIPFFIIVYSLRDIYRNFSKRLEQSRQKIQKETERVHQEERLIELGQLTSFMAHEIKNPLSIIRSCCELTAMNHSDQQATTEFMTDSIKQVVRICRMLDDVLNCTRKYVPVSTTFNLNDLVLEITKYITYSQLTFDFSKPLSITADRGHLHQILDNLIKNAIQAAGPKGKVYIRTCTQGPYPIFEVHDSGSGITEKDQKNIFKPFFTTKGKGGTGLGLSVSQNLCEVNKIEIEIDNSIYHGTCMRLIFAYQNFDSVTVIG